MFSVPFITKSKNVLHLSQSLSACFLICSELEPKYINALEIKAGDKLAFVIQRVYNKNKVQVLSMASQKCSAGIKAFSFVDVSTEVSDQVKKLRHVEGLISCVEVLNSRYLISVDVWVCSCWFWYHVPEWWAPVRQPVAPRDVSDQQRAAENPLHPGANSPGGVVMYPSSPSPSEFRRHLPASHVISHAIIVNIISYVQLVHFNSVYLYCASSQ